MNTGLFKTYLTSFRCKFGTTLYVCRVKHKHPHKMTTATITATTSQVNAGQWIYANHAIGEFVSAKHEASLATHFGSVPMYDHHIAITYISLRGDIKTVYMSGRSVTVNVLDASEVESCKAAYIEAKATNETL